MSEVQEAMAVMEVGGRVFTTSVKLAQWLAKIIVASINKMVGAEARMQRAKSKSSRIEYKQKKNDIKNAKLFENANGKLGIGDIHKLSKMSEIPVTEFQLDAATYKQLRKEAKSRGIVFAKLPDFKKDGICHVMLLENERNMKNFEQYLKSRKKSLPKEEQNNFDTVNKKESMSDYAKNSNLEHATEEDFKAEMEKEFGKDWEKTLPSDFQNMSKENIEQFFAVKKQGDYNASLSSDKHTVVEFSKRDVLDKGVDFSRIAIKDGKKESYIEVPNSLIKMKPGTNKFYAVLSNDKDLKVTDILGKEKEITNPKAFAEKINKNNMDAFKRTDKKQETKKTTSKSR